MADGKIYAAISGVMADVGAVGKNNTNQIQHYRFRGIDDVMNALYPAMVKNHVFVAPTVLEQTREERTTPKGGLLIYSIVRVNYKFYTDDGSFVEAVVIGEAMDSGDKSMNKAMSAAFKYASFQVFCIPTEEMKDSETDSPEPAPMTEDFTQIPSSPITKGQLAKIMAEMKRTGITAKSLCKQLKINDIAEITEARFPSIMDTFAKTPDAA